MIKDIEFLPKDIQKGIKDDIENRILPQARTVFEYTPEKFSTYIENEIENAIKCMNDMIKESQREGAIIQNISEVYVFNKERIAALKGLKETKQVPKSINTEPQQEQEKQKQARRKGNPKRTFKDCMIEDADGRKLQRIHKLINGRKGKYVSLIILACMKKGWIIKPTYTQVKNEFGKICSQQNFSNYLHEEKYDKDEIEGVMNSLD